MYVNDNNNVCFDNEDQCRTCEGYKKSSCILMQSIAWHYLSLNEPIVIDNCPYYKKFEKVLKVVKNE
jgi:hypothetical protein